jgi:pantothenate kinase
LSQVGLPASTTAASFGKVNSSKLSEYKVEDLAAALLNSFTYNIGQVFFFADIMVSMCDFLIKGFPHFIYV